MWMQLKRKHANPKQHVRIPCRENTERSPGWRVNLCRLTRYCRRRWPPLQVPCHSPRRERRRSKLWTPGWPAWPFGRHPELTGWASSPAGPRGRFPDRHRGWLSCLHRSRQRCCCSVTLWHSTPAQCAYPSGLCAVSLQSLYRVRAVSCFGAAALVSVVNIDSTKRNCMEVFSLQKLIQQHKMAF